MVFDVERQRRRDELDYLEFMERGEARRATAEHEASMLEFKQGEIIAEKEEEEADWMSIDEALTSYDPSTDPMQKFMHEYLSAQKVAGVTRIKRSDAAKALSEWREFLLKDDETLMSNEIRIKNEALSGIQNLPPYDPRVMETLDYHFGENNYLEPQLYATTKENLPKELAKEEEADTLEGDMLILEEKRKKELKKYPVRPEFYDTLKTVDEDQWEFLWETKPKVPQKPRELVGPPTPMGREASTNKEVFMEY